jgi:hypothetical protein
MDSAMSFLDGPYGLTLHVLMTMLIIELEWGIAVFIWWFFSSLVVFYSVGLVATAVSIISAAYYFTDETKDEMS